MLPNACSCGILQVAQEKAASDGSVQQLQGIRQQLETTIAGHEEYQSQIEGDPSNHVTVIGCRAATLALECPPFPALPTKPHQHP